MSCGMYCESIMKYFDGDLNDIESAQLKAHIKTCKQCGDEFEQLGNILNFIKNDSAVEPPEDFEAQVMNKVSAIETEGKKKSGILTILMLGLAGLVIFTLSSVLTYSILGISLTRFLLNVIGGNQVFGSVAAFINEIYYGGVTHVIEQVRSALEAGMALARTYYYFIVLIGVLLFAAQWMFIGVVKQNLKEKQNVVTEAN